MKQRLLKLWSSNRFRRIVYSLVFGIFIVAIYYFIRLLIPQELFLYNEIVTIVFIVISVLILFPARERILNRLLPRYEYTAFFGFDYHHLEFMARQFSVETLIHEIFPEFMEWLDVRQARLAILEPHRRFYEIYIYRNGRISGTQIQIEKTNALIRFLTYHGRAIELFDESLPDPIRRLLEEQHANSIHPFFYRQWMPGFLVLSEPPRHEFAERALEFFANKAAVSIQNHILTYRMIDSNLYDRELVAAQRVRKTLHQTPIPRLDGFELKRLIEPDAHPAILEFFRVPDGRWFLVTLSTPRFTGAAGIILYSILGNLYSIIHRESNITMHRLMSELRQEELPDSEYRIDILIAELRENEAEVIVLVEGDRYSLLESHQSGTNLISPGWRNFIDLKSKTPYRLEYMRQPILELIFRGDDSSGRVNPGAKQKLPTQNKTGTPEKNMKTGAEADIQIADQIGAPGPLSD
ncbi:MAG: hypothetical protein KDK30_03785 [Leptospiraceae bacterium]|nr:hypothetical protein [Leptospiraceae bacterium]